MSYKWGVIAALALFLAGIVAGLLLPANFANLLSSQLEALQKLAATLGPFKLSTALAIFSRNFTALWVSFLFSPILCLMPVLALTANGFLLGYVSTVVVQKTSLGFLLAGLLPHGILELPALIIGEGAALFFGAVTIGALFSSKLRGRWLPTLKNSLKYMVIATALLLPAAFIETFITPLLIGR